VEYPQRLSRGLALVKWWLLAIPQYIIIGVFTGGAGGSWWGWRLRYSHGVLNITENYGAWGSLGLIGIVAVIAAVVLLFTGRYPEQIYDFVLGMNRWVLQVAGYAGLMTDKYPPFRLDRGGPDPGTLTLPPTAGPRGERPSTMTTAGAVLGWVGLIVPLAVVVILLPNPLAIAALIVAISALVISYVRRNNRR
jgi:hypothetical protein